MTRLGPEILRRLAALGAATLYEAGGAVGAMDPAMRPAWPGSAVCGPAHTVECRVGDNLAIHRALESCALGEVLVVDGGGFIGGYWGEVMTVAARARGVAGLVIDGGLRDVAALERLGFPAFARGVGMGRTAKRAPGRVGEPVVVGGVRVEPGDVVVADGDGVLVVAAGRVAEVVQKGEARAAHEAHLMRRLEAGELTLDLLGLRPESGSGA